MAFDFHTLLASEKAQNTPPSQTARWVLPLFQATKGPVLDLGCGNGRDSLYFFEQGLQVVAVDIDAEAIGRLALKAEFECLVADALNLPFREFSFDAIYSFGLLHVFTESIEENRQQVLDEAWRVLKPGGIAVFTALWTDIPGCGLPELCCLTEAEVEQLVAR
ncbi:MAG: class I SAM-dependent methyltransferase, partial [Bacillota bacterium]